MESNRRQKRKEKEDGEKNTAHHHNVIYIYMCRDIEFRIYCDPRRHTTQYEIVTFSAIAESKLAIEANRLRKSSIRKFVCVCCAPSIGWSSWFNDNAIASSSLLQESYQVAIRMYGFGLRVMIVRMEEIIKNDHIIIILPTTVVLIFAISINDYCCH